MVDDPVGSLPKVGQTLYVGATASFKQRLGHHSMWRFMYGALLGGYNLQTVLLLWVEDGPARYAAERVLKQRFDPLFDGERGSRGADNAPEWEYRSADHCLPLELVLASLSNTIANYELVLAELGGGAYAWVTCDAQAASDAADQPTLDLIVKQS